MDNRLEITIRLNDLYERKQEIYSHIRNNKDNYNTPLEYESYQNYFKYKQEHYDFLTALATGTIKSTFNAVQQTFIKKADKIVEREADRLVKAWVKSNPNLSWED